MFSIICVAWPLPGHRGGEGVDLVLIQAALLTCWISFLKICLIIQLENIGHSVDSVLLLVCKLSF